MTIQDTMLVSLLDKMDVPQQRKTLTLYNLQWLQRNLGIRNKAHPNYNQAMNLINNHVLNNRDQ